MGGFCGKPFPINYKMRDKDRVDEQERNRKRSGEQERTVEERTVLPRTQMFGSLFSDSDGSILHVAYPATESLETMANFRDSQPRLVIVTNDGDVERVYEPEVSVETRSEKLLVSHEYPKGDEEPATEKETIIPQRDLSQATEKSRNAPPKTGGVVPIKKPPTKVKNIKTVKSKKDQKGKGKGKKVKK